ncbi:beta-N-acetylhexosaminidase [Solitalea koreensis]|uniref:beta-N-acetylhexosaminidase n=1 Tax=Solitalea koreensis TaxID=543615 RepID=A0A521D2A3_9SPHI|nr:family 20 glycosylhydrolase [Solitalea koreensis]SMO65829.1 hexosaminidase [Solitalea koreensis]
MLRRFLLSIIALLFIFSATFAQTADINIIPQPVLVNSLGDFFKLDRDTKIIFNNEESKKTAEFFSNIITVPTGLKLPLQDSSAKSIGKEITVQFIINAKIDSLIGKEGYRLKATPKKVEIVANTGEGLFYGMQTLLQLLPKEIERKTASNQPFWSVPCVEIVDYPRFGWRGLMLDVSRHFFPKEYVKKYIDQMVKYKFNVFHWHLTDDQGWRIEIKSFPKLTQVGAWRVPRSGEWRSNAAPEPGEANTYGGFYTQEDIKEVVAYAAERHVTILPEIDVPGHSMAALTAYPELSCFGGPFTVNVGNKFYKQQENSLCPGNECSFEFMDSVITEVARLFPGTYIHIGGDECYKGFWEKCPKCKARMKTDSIASLAELQSYFIHRMEQIVISKGKRMIGWDEILEGGLAPEATVMSWRGMQGGIEAAQMGHQVIMTPDKFCYLDLYQGDPIVEPYTYSSCRLSSSYSFEPVPPNVDPKFILGGQGNLWTEAVPNTRHAEYMTWPRGLALSEVLWSQKQNKNWNSFTKRMEVQFERFDQAEIKYARSSFDPMVKLIRDTDFKNKVQVNTEVSGLDIYFSFDGTEPDQFYQKYAGPLEIPKGADTFKAVSYRNGEQVGRMITLKMKELERRR